MASLVNTTVTSAAGSGVALAVTGGNDLVDNILLNLLNHSGSTVLNVRNNGALYGTDGTFSGSIYINDTNTRIHEGTTNSVRIQTNSGYLDLGPMNTSYAHLQTDRGRFYFNRELVVDSGIIRSYNEDLQFDASYSGAVAKNIIFRTGNVEKVRMNTDGNVGIGTTNPSQKLHVNGNITVNSQVIFSSGSNQYLEIGTNSIALKNSGGTVLWNSATALDSSTAWANMGAGTRTNYTLKFQPPASSYAGFQFLGTNSSNAGYFLIRGTSDDEVYTAEGITLVADQGWLTLAQRTATSKGVRIMTGSGAGSNSRVRINVSTDGDIVLGVPTNSLAPATTTTLKGYSVQYDTGGAGERLSNTGFLIWHTGGSWTGNERMWAFTNADNMGGGGGPRFTLLRGSNNSTVPTLGNNGSLGTNTLRTCYWTKDGDFYNSGNIGIGAESPVGDLMISRGSSAGAEIQFHGTDTAYHRLGIRKTGSRLDMGEYSNDGNTLTPILTVDGDGDRVGIGTTDPGFKLHVAGGDVRLTTYSNSVYFGSTRLLGYDSSNAANLWIIGGSGGASGSCRVTLGTGWNWDTSCDFHYAPGTAGAGNGILTIGQQSKNNANFTHGITRFFTKGAERVRINADGNVGIGEDLPLAKLQIEGTDIILNTEGSYQSKYFYMRYVGENNKGRIRTDGNMTFETGGTPVERMRIGYGGNVGIGTTDPGQKLDVVGIIRSHSTNPQVRIQTSSGTGAGYLVFGDSSDDDRGQIYYSHSNDSMVFIANATNMLTLTSGALYPSSNGTKDLGLSGSRWNNVYSEAGNFSGTVTAAAFSGTADKSNMVTGSAFATTGSPGSVLEYQQAASITDTKLAPTTDWYNTIRMGHGNPYSYYSNTIAMQMTGTGAGQIKTQRIANNVAQGWRTVWDSGNDGSGSGLDADKLDGLDYTHFAYRASGGTGYYIVSSWLQFSGTYGPYWNAGVGQGWHIYPASTDSMRWRAAGAGVRSNLRLDVGANNYGNLCASTTMGYGLRKANVNLSTDSDWDLLINTDGNVGIGTTDPSALLEVGNDGSTDYALIGPTKIGGGFGHGDYAGFSHRDRSTTTSYALLQHTGGTTYLNSNIRIYMGVNNANYTAQVESDRFQVNNTLKLNDNSKIKIGSSDDLEIYHNSADSFISDVGTGNLVISGSGVWIKNAAINANMIGCVEGSGGYVKLYQNGNEKLATSSVGVSITGRLNTSGRVGINGTTIPTYSLNVYANTANSATGSMHINAALNGSGKGLVINSQTRTTSENSVAALEIINRAGGNTLTATVAGNVGIGTTQPSQKLDVNGNTELNGSVNIVGGGWLSFDGEQGLRKSGSWLYLADGGFTSGLYTRIKIRTDGYDISPYRDTANVTSATTLGLSTKRWYNVYSQAGNFSGFVIAGGIALGAGNLTTTGNISGNGSGLTALNASNIGSGTVPAARLGSGATSSKFLRGDNTWQTVSSGSNPNNATITLSAGTNLSGGGNFTTNQSSNETITFNMATGGFGAGTYGSTSDSSKIDQITLDAYGRVTNITTGGTGAGDITAVNVGGALSGGGSSGSVTVSLGNAGAGAGTYGDTSNSVKIDQITLDQYGRVTNITTGATGSGSMSGWYWGVDSSTATYISNGETVRIKGGTNVTVSRSGNDVTINASGGGSTPNNKTITLSAGNGLSNGGAFTTNQSFNETITFNITGLNSSGNGSTVMNHISVGAGTAQTSSNGISFSQSGGISISASGSTVSFSSSSASDYRLKKNVTDFNSESWTKVKSVSCRKFDFDAEKFAQAMEDDYTIPRPASYGGRIGFIAHELEALGIDGAVEGEKDGVDENGVPIYQKVSYTTLVPVLWGALNEAIRKIEILESKVQALEDSS